MMNDDGGDAPSDLLKDASNEASNDGGSEVYLMSEEIADLVRGEVARRLGLQLPVDGVVHWMWSPGKGPVARVCRLGHSKNVVRLEVVR